ncbi:MAG: hypothetical protein IKQ90_00355 [Ruminococcus sp.]|nr:hypothetical protein [Ruminococcus sp.]
MKKTNIIAGISAAVILLSGTAFSASAGTEYDPAASMTAYADEYDVDVYDDIDEYAEDEDSYSSENETVVRSKKERSNPVIVLLIWLGISLIIAGIAVGSMWSKLKTVHKKNNAADYQKPNSFKVNVSRDNFLYKKVEKKRRANTNNS